MSGCRFPLHHKSGKDSSVLLSVAAVVAAVVLAVKAVMVITAFVAAHLVWFIVVPSSAAAVVTVYVLARTAPRSRAAFRHWPRAVWVRLRWRPVTRQLGLAKTDTHRADKIRRGRALRPRVHHLRCWIRPDAYGLIASVRTIPGTGRAEVEAAAVHLANHFGACRVAVSQPRPGRLQVRAFRTDPLAAPLEFATLPAFDGRHLVLGRDENGTMRRVSLAGLSGCAYTGNPGRGKTEAALSLACQLAPSPLVDLYVMDGGACDWAHFADGAAGYVADDLDAAADLLHELAAGMAARRRTLEADLGVRNGWHVGPSSSYRLRWLLVEEAPFYLDAGAVKGDKRREGLVATCQGLIGGLLRRGRAPLHFTTLIAQKGTGTGGLPPDLRDLCGLRWSFGVATIEAAAGILGADIRQFPTLCPTTLQDRIGVASALLPTAGVPYTLLRFPAVGEATADQAAALTASLRRAPAAPAQSPAPEAARPPLSVVA